MGTNFRILKHGDQLYYVVSVLNYLSYLYTCMYCYEVINENHTFFSQYKIKLSHLFKFSAWSSKIRLKYIHWKQQFRHRVLVHEKKKSK